MAPPFSVAWRRGRERSRASAPSGDIAREDRTVDHHPAKHGDGEDESEIEHQEQADAHRRVQAVRTNGTPDERLCE